VDEVELAGMPEPSVLQVLSSDGQTMVTFGRWLVCRYDSDDLGMRNLAIVALTDAKQPIKDVAAAFGMTATYVSMLRTRARAQGSAGLVRPLGRPPKLSARQVTKAREGAAQGRTQQAIADEFGVARSVISELLAKLGPAPAQQCLPAEEPAEETVGEAMDELVPVEPDEPDELVNPVVVPVAEGFTGSARIGVGTHRCRYAGAMLLHPFLHRVGAESIFATLAGGPARRYDDLAVLSTATLGFALGIDTVEGSKHLRRAEAGAAVGLTITPELKTFRTRLGALADGCDPLELQRAFAAGMLSADPAADPVYFVDDHFVPYSGARPVAKGWNTKRRHAQPGQDDTMLTDARGRAVIFGSGEPSGLVTTLPGVLTQLREVLGPEAKILLGFDRGGAFASAFRACREAGADWVTYRRAPLLETTIAPRQSWTVRDGKRISVMLADETVQLKDYGPARQLTLFQNGLPILQVLTSDLTATGAALLCWLRARWRIENMFKYAVQHNGIDRLTDYVMDLAPDTRKVPNPARKAARTTVAAAQGDLIKAERALPQLLTSGGTPKQLNAQLPGLHRQITKATAALEAAKTALRPIPAKVLATDLDPNAQRARPRLERRGLQMVLRLLAFNAEAWLAEHFNAYLSDPNEHRAILRHLLRLGGQIDYTKSQIIITLDQPDSPRVARALELLTQELNATPASLPGDRRPLTYQVNAA
jgi:transposase